MTAAATREGHDAAAARCELAQANDEPALRRLLREGVMAGAIHVAMTREPSYFASMAVEGEDGRQRTFVLRAPAEGTVLAMGSRSVHAVRLHGQVQRLGYLGQLRLARGCRWRRKDIARGFAFARSLRASDELPFDLTSIAADNDVVRRLIERGLPGMPRYQPLAKMVSLVMPTRRLRRDPPQVRTATRDDLPAIAAMIEAYHRRRPLAPLCSHTQLSDMITPPGRAMTDMLLIERDGRMIACAAVQDLRCHRQTLVAGYAPGIARWRHAINVGLRLVAQPALPPSGTTLAMGYLSYAAVCEDDAQVWRMLIAAARSHAARRRLSHLLLGLCSDHPAVTCVRRSVHARAYHSRLYLVHDPDVSLSAYNLDGRNIHMELASL